ncbi:MAG: hypothetical protein V9E86_07840 [Nitrosomonas sp.]
MSKQPFNVFLVGSLVAWLENRLLPGYRYRFYSDDADQIADVLSALEDIKTGELNYLNIALPYIEIEKIRLVYVNDVKDIMNEHFISNLRDAVSHPDDVFINCALLVLHKSSLDTLLNSAHDWRHPEHHLMRKMSENTWLSSVKILQNLSYLKLFLICRPNR